jgi:hypothetical protein
MSEKDIEKMKQFLEEKKKKAAAGEIQHPSKKSGGKGNTKGFSNKKSGGSLNK